MSAVRITNSAELDSFIESLHNQCSAEEVEIRVGTIPADRMQRLAEALEANHTLTTIDLGFNKLGDEGARLIAEALKVNQTLTSIDLSSNNLGAEGARLIAEALKVNQTLTSIDLGYNAIGDEGAQFIAAALRENQTLTSIDLGYNAIGDEGAGFIAEALRVNQTLTNISLSYDGSVTQAEKDAIDIQIGYNKQLAEVARKLNCLIKADTPTTAENLATRVVIYSRGLRKREGLPQAACRLIAESLSKEDILRLAEAVFLITPCYKGNVTVPISEGPGDNPTIIATMFVGGAVFLASVILGLPIVAAVLLAVCSAVTEYYTGSALSMGNWVGSILTNKGLDEPSQTHAKPSAY